MTDDQGQITLAKAYNPYGVVTSRWSSLSRPGAGQTSYGYTNEYQSQEGIYLRARMYAPATGRFLTRDTWSGDESQPMSYNAWLYEYANPVMYADPTGFYPLALFGVGWENGSAEKAVWSAKEMHLIMQAVDKIQDSRCLCNGLQ